MAGSVGAPSLTPSGPARTLGVMPAPRTVVILAYEGVQALDITGPHEVFAGASTGIRSRTGAPAYVVMVVGSAGGPVRTESGLTIVAADAAEVGAIDTLIVPGGSGVLDRSDDPATV